MPLNWLMRLITKGFHFLWWDGKEAANHPLYHKLHTCYNAIEGSKEKDSVNGRSSRPDVFYKKVFLKISQRTQENTFAGASLK